MDRYTNYIYGASVKVENNNRDKVTLYYIVPYCDAEIKGKDQGSS